MFFIGGVSHYVKNYFFGVISFYKYQFLRFRKSKNILQDIVNKAMNSGSEEERYQILNTPLNEDIVSLAFGEALTNVKGKFLVDSEYRDVMDLVPVDESVYKVKDKNSVYNWNSLALAICLLDVPKVLYIVKSIGRERINNLEWFVGGYRQPFQIAHLIFYPQIISFDFKINYLPVLGLTEEEFLNRMKQIVDILLDFGLDFNNQSDYKFSGYRNPPVLGGEARSQWMTKQIHADLIEYILEKDYDLDICALGSSQCHTIGYTLRKYLKPETLSKNKDCISHDF